MTGVPSVVTVTLRAPSVAAPSIRMFAVTLVTLLNCTESTVMPDPKLTVDAGEKLVFCPVITTASDWPCVAVAGAAEIMRGVATTLKRPIPVRGAPFVVTVTSRRPGVAPASMEILAVRLEALLKPTEVTLIPGPKLTVEAGVKLVFRPVIVTLRLWLC